MADDWVGEKGRFWAEHADWFTRLLGGFFPPLLSAASFSPDERVLDVGCGCGDLSLAAARVAGAVVGVDLSADELAVAVQRAAGLDHVSFELGDAGAIELSPPFDVLVSRFGVMFFDDPVATFAHLRSLLADDGRLAFVAWTRPQDNTWQTVPKDAIASIVPLPPPPPPDAPGPYGFADGDRVRRILGDAGFTEVALEPITAAVDLGRDLDEAVRFWRQTDLARAALDQHPEDVQATAMAAVRDALAEHVGPDGVRLPGHVWLVTARA